jgi:acyl-coenzyme A thioesterase PaaI-like protein
MDDHPHFVGAMGLRNWAEGETTFGSAAISELLCVPGTAYPRISALATMVDVVAGSRPDGPINPTVDLRIELMAVVAMSTVRVRCEVLRSGRRLFVAQSRLYADDAEQPFGRSVVTFINRQMPNLPEVVRPGGRNVPPLRVRIDELLGVRIVDPTTIEIDSIPRLSNGPGGTLQGGVVALLGELVTEHAVGGDGAVVTDLDIRYLNPVQSGLVRAHAEVLHRTDDRVEANVRIVDAGNADGLVAHIMTTARLL